MKILITGACAVSARSVVRSLRKSPKFCNCEFIGWDMATTLYGLYEGLFDKIYKVPAVTDSTYGSIAQKIIDEEKPDAAIIVPEIEVLYWAKNPFNLPHIVPPLKFCEVAISKKKVFEILAPHNLIPKSFQVSRIDILNNNYIAPLSYPLWIRDSSAGTASGKGSFKANNLYELHAWVNINTGIDEFQLSQYLPGGNYGVFCLFNNGDLKKVAIAERIEYIMSKVAVSGITGNTSKGRLLNDDKIKDVALKAIEIIRKNTNSIMNGLVVVDMKADENGNPLVTEINIRHVAFSSSFANAGFNLSEYQLLCALNRQNELTTEVEKIYPKNNLILRDVDGQPLYIENYTPLKNGEYISK